MLPNAIVAQLFIFDEHHKVIDLSIELGINCTTSKVTIGSDTQIANQNGKCTNVVVVIIFVLVLSLSASKPMLIPFKCFLCENNDIQFAQRSDLKTHLASKHVHYFDFRCEICPAMLFSTAIELRQHYETVHNKNMFKVISFC